MKYSVRVYNLNLFCDSTEIKGGFLRKTSLTGVFEFVRQRLLHKSMNFNEVFVVVVFFDGRILCKKEY